MNKVYLGFSKQIELPKNGFLFIGDDIPAIPRARIFDPARYHLNPLKNIDYKKARELADVLYTLYPQGENTLTVRNGKRELLKTLLTTTRFDKLKEAPEEVKTLLADILISPLLNRILSKATNFSFNPRSIILVRLNRREIGTFDALALGLIIINHYKGQLVIPDFGFYGRDTHVSLINENRLIAGLNFLQEVPLRLRHALLSAPQGQASGALYDDAVTLAQFAGLRPDPTREDNEYNDFIRAAMT